MSDEAQFAAVGAAPDFRDKVLWTIIGLFMLSAAARNLLSSEPFDPRRFLGEILLSIVGAVIMWSFGLMQGMSTAQIFFIGGLAALGGVRAIEWGLKIMNTVRSSGNLPPR
ncbi:hypothetical protein [Methylocaldum szegediense]|uniref:hypothetical protein n=1 Tax=Methylocaldum szegediense TaxID=73780 RepID=UPI0003F96E42|nr:hypothetical protein [Methylocaldum szegediense]